MKNILISGIIVPTIITLFAFSCKTRSEKVTTEETTTVKTIYLIKVSEPSNGMLYNQGDNVNLVLKLDDASVTPDSIIVFSNDKRLAKITGLSYTVKTNDLGLGTLVVRATAYKGGMHQTASVSVKLKSNVAPKKYTYRVIKTFPHDPDAYTQGLFYKDGFLYEGTGQNGSSTVRKVELETGKVLQSINIERKHFGEGIALFNDKIYELTWTSDIGFVYDFTTFKQERTFSYNTQGWGLTTNGKDLIMSDGSNTIYYMEPDNFTETKRIEVFDNKGPVDMLNELELIKGDLYANVYQTDLIVIINPETGMVKGVIDFKGLLKDSDRTDHVDVLNGIAWDETGNRFFVTGKLWPKLFQVEIIPQ